MTRQGNAQFIMHHRTVLHEHLPRPGRKWAWHECSLSEELRQKLLDRDCIERDDTTGLWETKQSFFDRVERLTSGDDAGEPVGQEPLIDAGDIGPEKISRVLAPHRPGVESEQLTLNGDKAILDEADDLDSVRKCWKAAELANPVAREQRGAGQSSLHGVTWSDAWDVMVRDALPLTTSTGEVYPEDQRIYDAARLISSSSLPSHFRN